MTERKQCEFQLIRYVPDPVRNEFVNVGVLLRFGEQSELRFTRDWRRVRCLDPDADTEMLEALEVEVAHRLRAPTGAQQRQTLDLLEASLSNGVQITESKGYLAETFPAGLEDLMRLYVDPPRKERTRRRSGREGILTTMQEQFKKARVWDLMRKQIRASEYTEPGDPMRIDCGYRNGTMKLFQAVSLEKDAVDAQFFALSSQRLKDGVKKREGVELDLAVITEPIGWPEDGGEPDEERKERYQYVSRLLERCKVRMLTTSDLPNLAEAARIDLRV